MNKTTAAKHPVPPPALVTDQDEFDALCEAWRAAGCFAFDTEFIRDDTYDAALCLLQVATGDGVRLIDPTAGLRLDAFWALVTDPALIKIVHAGKEDLELCLRATGRSPRRIFDVQIAAGFIGYAYPLSLLRMVEQVLHRRIAKAQTLTDWARRPLTAEQLQYAVEDVAYLPDVYTKLQRKLEEAGRVAWADEEFARFEEAEFYRPPVRERLYKLKGSRRLDGLGLLVLEKLVEWRARWAENRNRPIRAMMRDDVLVDIARRRPRLDSELAVLRGFPQARNPRIIREILDLIEEARRAPRSAWPEAFDPPDETPMMKATLDLLSAVTRAICVEDNVSKDLVGSSQRLVELLYHLAEPGGELPPLLRGWRGDFIGRRLVDVLQGRSELHFSGWPANPRLDVITHAP